MSHCHRETRERFQGSARHGLGVLLMLVMVFLTILSFVGLARSFFSKSVTSQVMRSSLGVQAQNLAESAAEEALVELRKRVNDPSSGNEIFQIFRQEALAGQSNEFEVRVPTPVFDSMYDRFPEVRDFTLEDRRVSVDFQRQFSVVPYEHYGLVKVSAQVGASLGFASSVSRQVELGLEFKVHLLSTPRPFDQTGIYIHDGDDFLRRVSEMVDDMIQSIEFRRSEHEDLIQRLESQSGGLPFSAPAMLARYEGNRIPERAYWRAKAPAIRGSSALFALGRAPRGVDLETLRFPAQLEEAYRQVQSAEEAYETARAELDSNFSSDRLHQVYLDRLRLLQGSVSEAIGKVESFRSQYRIYDGAQYAKLEPFGFKLKPDEWQRKATHILDRDPKNSPPQKVLEDILKGSKNGTFGVLYSNWPQKSIKLRNRDLKGRIVLVTENTDLELSNVNRGASSQDLLTIVSFGRLTLRGKIHASILALGELVLEGDTEIVGNLVFDRVKNPRGFRGRVIHDPKYHSGRTTKSDVTGAFQEHYFVTVAPRPIYKAVTRR